MKTIKYFLLGLLSLFITVLLIKYAVISFNYIIIDFQPVGSTDVYNFGLTFFIQCVLLLILASASLTTSLASFSLSHKYYQKWCNTRRDLQLFKHIKDEKYNEVCKNISKASNSVVKEALLKNYLYDTPLFKEKIEKTNDIVNRNNKERVDNIVFERDTYNPIEFERKESITYKGNSFGDPKDNTTPRE